MFFLKNTSLTSNFKSFPDMADEWDDDPVSIEYIHSYQFYSKLSIFHGVFPLPRILCRQIS